MAASPAKASRMLTVTLPSDLEITLTRSFDAPRTLVFKAMSDPALIPKWWGPHGGTTIVDKMDVRAGGEWRFRQTMSNGKWTSFYGVYREVLPPDRLVFTFEWEGMPGHVSVQTVTLEERGGQTMMTGTLRFDSVADRDGMLRNGMEKGAVETWDRFAAMLAELGRRAG